MISSEIHGLDYKPLPHDCLTVPIDEIIPSTSQVTKASSSGIETFHKLIKDIFWDVIKAEENKCLTENYFN